MAADSKISRFSFFLSNESGIAYGIYAFGIFLLFAGLVVAIYSNVFNGLFTGFNSLITAGLVGEQTNATMTFLRNVIAALPVFILIGALLWMWVRSLESKSDSY